MTLNEWVVKHYGSVSEQELAKMGAAWVACAHECAAACANAGSPYRHSSMKVALTTDACIRACQLVGKAS